jgi:hypothetical protein
MASCQSHVNHDWNSAYYPWVEFCGLIYIYLCCRRYPTTAKFFLSFCHSILSGLVKAHKCRQTTKKVCCPIDVGVSCVDTRYITLMHIFYYMFLKFIPLEFYNYRDSHCAVLYSFDDSHGCLATTNDSLVVRETHCPAFLWVLADESEPPKHDSRDGMYLICRTWYPFLVPTTLPIIPNNVDKKPPVG